MKSLFGLFLIMLFTHCAQGQCPKSLYFCSQADVDSFPLKYSGCVSFDSIVIDDDCGTINNLRPLLGIKFIKNLYLIALFELESVAGFDSLTEVNKLYSAGNPKIGSDAYFPNLIKINNIEHYFIGEEQDLSVYRKLKYLNILTLIYNGNLKGLDSLKPNPNLFIGIRENNNLNDLASVIPKGSTNILHLGIDRCSNIKLSGAENVNFDRIQIAYSSIDYINVLDKSKLGYLTLNKVKGIDQLIFPSIDSINVLVVANFDSLIDLDIMFPNLAEVKSNVILLNNKQLYDIEIFNGMNLPSTYTTWTGSNKIAIIGNSNLEMCNSKFICDALATYPDSVDIYNNGVGCNEEELLLSCISHIHETDPTEEPKIYPNPFNEYLNIEFEYESYELFDTQGKLIVQGRSEQDINTNNLEKGVYLLKLKQKSRQYIKRVVKEE